MTGDPDIVKRGPGRPPLNREIPMDNIERSPMRSEMRPESSKELAAKRAAEILGNTPDFEGVADEFWIDPAMIPDGWDYNWKTKTVWEKENPSYDVSLARTGWTPVPASRHPELMPAGYKGDTILRKGQQLMERPMEITRRVMEMDKARARQQVTVKEDQLNSKLGADFTRDNKGDPIRARGVSGARKSYEPMAIPT